AVGPVAVAIGEARVAGRDEALAVRADAGAVRDRADVAIRLVGAGGIREGAGAIHARGAGRAGDPAAAAVRRAGEDVGLTAVGESAVAVGESSVARADARETAAADGAHAAPVSERADIARRLPRAGGVRRDGAHTVRAHARRAVRAAGPAVVRIRRRADTAAAAERLARRAGRRALAVDADLTARAGPAARAAVGGIDRRDRAHSVAEREAGRAWRKARWRRALRLADALAADRAVRADLAAAAAVVGIDGAVS